MTALMWAAREGHFEVTKVLIEAGASIEAKSNVSKTIFILSYVCVCVFVSFYFILFMSLLHSIKY